MDEHYANFAIIKVHVFFAPSYGLEMFYLKRDLAAKMLLKLFVIVHTFMFNAQGSTASLASRT